MKRALKGIVLFFGFILIFLIIAAVMLPEGPDGEVLIPQWYFYIMVIASVALAVCLSGSGKKKNKRPKVQIADTIKGSIEQRWRQKEYDNLSEVEKWQLDQQKAQVDPDVGSRGAYDYGVDELTNQAALFVIRSGLASISALQRQFGLSYGYAAAIADRLETIGVIGPFEGTHPRAVLMTEGEYTERVALESKIEPEPVKPIIDTEAIVQEEIRWQQMQSNLSPTDYELQRIDSMEGHQFEHWCADLLKKNDFSSAEVTPGSNDQGVDIVAVKDGIRYAIQCKCYSSDLGNTPVQEVYAGKEMYGCQVAAVMTNRHFTAGAKQLAERTRVLLWDRDKLKEML